MARKQITTEKLKFKFAGPSRACARNEWKLVPLNQILKLKKLQGYIGKSSNSAAWKPPLPVKAPDRRRTSVIPSASEGPRQSPLITQARFGHRSAHVRSLLAFASRDDSCENVPLPL